MAEAKRPLPLIYLEEQLEDIVRVLHPTSENMTMCDALLEKCQQLQAHNSQLSEQLTDIEHRIVELKANFLCQRKIDMIEYLKTYLSSALESKNPYIITKAIPVVEARANNFRPTLMTTMKGIEYYDALSHYLENAKQQLVVMIQETVDEVNYQRMLIKQIKTELERKEISKAVTCWEELTFAYKSLVADNQGINNMPQVKQLVAAFNEIKQIITARVGASQLKEYEDQTAEQWCFRSVVDSPQDEYHPVFVPKW